MIVLTVKQKGQFMAGPKAPSDIIDILKSEYSAKSVLLVASNGIGKINYRLKIFNTIMKAKLKNEVLVLQYPMYETSKMLNKLFLFSLKRANKNKTIVLIHDIDSLRSPNSIVDLKMQEYQRLKDIKYIIVHNDKMKEYLVSQNIKGNIYTLKLFDYLCDEKYKYRKKLELSLPLKVIYAGNLLKEKSPFLHQLDPKKMNFEFNVYGVGIEKDISNKEKYMGKFDPNELPDKLDGNIGLVWDGDVDDKDSEGFKKYTKINNPHKLSCYMAAGLPVAVWSKSAISEFVKKNNVGYCINNIYDLNNLDLSDYHQKCCNVAKIQEKARNGYYTKTVFDKILKDMEKNNGK